MKNCKFCHTSFIPTNPHSHNVVFCSVRCRNKQGYIDRGGKKAQREYLYKHNGGESDEKIQCLICGRWYRQVGSHIYQLHKMTARSYREEFKLEVKRGLTKGWYRELKGEQAIMFGGVDNLKQGAKYRFKKGQSYNYVRSPITIERLRQNQKLSQSGKKHYKLTQK